MEERTELQVIVAESGLSETKAQTLLDKFSGYFAMAADWEAKAKMLIVTDESQVAEMKMAREGRLFLKAKRVELEKTRVSLKADIVREGKGIDGIANVLKAVIVPIEEYLDDQEHFVEHKRAAEEEARRMEAEKLLIEKEEAERVAREKEIKEQAAENTRLKKEAKEREAAIQAQREEAERKAETARKEADRKLAAERKIADEKAEKELEASVARIAEEREKAAKEAERVRKEADRKAKADREALAKKHAEELKLASVVTCPKCGHQFSTIGGE